MTLLAQANINHFGPFYYEDIVKIQDSLTTDKYSIVVFNRDDGNSLLFNGGYFGEGTKRLYLRYSKNHFSAVISIRGFLRHKYICGKCLTTYNYPEDHLCFCCHVCYTPLGGCAEQSVNPRTCIECRRTFESEKCFENHLHRTDECSLNTCERIKRCEKCNATYKTRFGEHICDVFYCRVCMKPCRKGHNHFITKYTVNGKKPKLKRLEKATGKRRKRRGGRKLVKKY